MGNINRRDTFNLFLTYTSQHKIKYIEIGFIFQKVIGN